MSEPRRFLDVWIVENNTVYKEVPFTVVVDWVQQGRLLEDDQVKGSGTRDWQRIGDHPDFSPYLLRPEPGRPEDEAAAQEPVGRDFAVAKSSHGAGEDDEVDMIPLIDVSLVLLVFFMLSASAGAAAVFVNTPETEYGQMVENPGTMRIDITREADGSPVFALGMGDEQPGEEERDLRDVVTLLARLKSRLARMQGNVELVINADKDIPMKVPREILAKLRAEPFRSRLTANYFGVSEKRE